MSIYVMSDLHGEADLFHAMLRKISFSEQDKLIILGDVIDRGPLGISLLTEIMDTPNMEMLLGNHEYMMLQYFDPQATPVEILRWGKNGNEPTIAEYDRLQQKQKDEIINFLQKLPTHMEIDLGSKKYYLVHAFPGANVHNEVWVRPSIDTPNPLEGVTLIIGHTPVLHLIADKEERPECETQMISRGEHPRIHYAEGFTDIDCGCSYIKPIKSLGCLRLEDMTEFYVNHEHI